MPQVVTSEVSSLFKERSHSTNPQLPRAKKNPAPVILAIAILATLAIGVGRMLTAKPEVKQTVTVVGAGSDLAPGARIYFSNLHYIEVPEKYITPDMFTSNEQVVGSVLKHYVPQGEPISKQDLFNGKNSFSNNLETHERAITLRLEPQAMVDNELAPDDMVDVLSTATREGKNFTKTICQNARVVLAMPRQALESRTLRTHDGHRVTLAVGPKEAELISHAAETAKIRLVLRSRLSRKVTRLSGVADEDLLPRQAFVSAPSATLPALLPAPPVPPTAEIPLEQPAPLIPPAISKSLTAPVQWVVEMFSGSKKELYALPTQH